MPSIEDSTRLVITTSKENWYGFEAMNDFVKKARKSRYKHSAILEFSGDIEVIEVMSNKIMKLTKSGPSEVMCHGLSFDHSKVQAQILSLPGCAPKARCQRCQVLFRFSVTPSVLQLERYPGYASDSEEYIGTNTGMDCAECFAHFYCKAAFGTGTRIEKVDSPLH